MIVKKIRFIKGKRITFKEIQPFTLEHEPKTLRGAIEYML